MSKDGADFLKLAIPFYLQRTKLLSNFNTSILLGAYIPTMSTWVDLSQFLILTLKIHGNMHTFQPKTKISNKLKTISQKNSFSLLSFGNHVISSFLEKHEYVWTFSVQTDFSNELIIQGVPEEEQTSDDDSKSTDTTTCKKAA